ncbi:MAG: DUF4266 domain-containing protein [Chitinophagaceae bacterium]|nr:DUF4266 domain-containing protein [Chitinophagaceae bacterium]MCB9044915.1 DUF4266 domain-containing protein [Chitinophagales bacterium]
MSNKQVINTALLAMVLFAGACTSVKEYQKQYINDAEMELSARKSEMFESSFQSYREGASGANGGKTGGGCGCN